MLPASGKLIFRSSDEGRGFQLQSVWKENMKLLIYIAYGTFTLVILACMEREYEVIETLGKDPWHAEQSGGLISTALLAIRILFKWVCGGAIGCFSKARFRPASLSSEARFRPALLSPKYSYCFYNLPLQSPYWLHFCFSILYSNICF